MKLENTQIQRTICVTVQERKGEKGKTRKSKAFTIYDAGLDEVLKVLKDAIRREYEKENE